MRNYRLVKTKASTYSCADLEREGRAVWNGVTNVLALKHLRAMRKGDLAFIYHTGDEKQIVGIAEVVSDPYPDPKQGDEKLAVVDLKPRERLRRAVTLAEVKAGKDVANFESVRVSRLSVMPVSVERWKKLYRMAHDVHPLR
jgi:predicted RNA-binding protein with PUA-like domain